MRILFTTAFQPFGIDDRYGRRDGFPEVFHDRLTRADGIFSYRGHFNMFGLHVIANNISATSTVLEYPSLPRFREEVKKGYDYIGLGGMVVNFQKFKLMAELVRELSPRTKIIVGGYCAEIERLQEMMPLDYLCTGEGISFMRELIGDPPEFEFRNPDVYSRAHSFLGVPLFGRRNPHIVIGLGCPYGCEYCSPSHHFGRKYIRFFKTGEAIFAEMERMEARFHNRTFGFIGDDNFLLDLKRAEELRQGVVKSGKPYEIFYFASADKIEEYGPARMAEMGTNLVWIGRESCLIPQRKVGGADLKALIADLHRHGIKVVVSSMLLMEHHTPENIWQDVNAHFELRPDFSMFTYYAPLPGTPLYDRMKKEDRILWTVPYEDWHGISQPWVSSPSFPPLEAKRLRDRVLEREFQELGPSAARLILSDLEAYLYLRNSAAATLRQRARRLAKKMPQYRALLWAMVRLAPTAAVRNRIAEVLAKIEAALGPTTRWERIEGMGLWLFGTKEKLRHRWFGDVIQPPTIVTRYRGRR